MPKFATAAAALAVALGLEIALAGTAARAAASQGAASQAAGTARIHHARTHDARNARARNARAQAIGEPGEAMDAARAATLRDCSGQASKLVEYTWGNEEFDRYRACMMQHGQPE